MIDSACYTAKEIAYATGGRLVGEDVLIESITTDSREKSKKKTCFFAIKGEKYNGAYFVNEAISNGAKIIVSSEKVDTKIPVIYVDNSVRALGLLGKYHKGNTRVVGITGSFGKTTTKNLTHAVLREGYSVLATNGNNNNEIGVAKTLLSIKNEEICVVEMGMRNLGDIDWLGRIAEPCVSIITNCGKAHLERLLTEENIFLAKTEILKHTKNLAILPSETRFKELKIIKNSSVYFGKGGDCFINRYNARGESIKFSINYFGEIISRLMLNTYYKHNLDNALCAVAVGKYFGLSQEDIREGLKKYRGGSLREEIVKINGAEIIVDCYNAGYESMKNAITMLSSRAKIKGCMSLAVLGDMLELGKNSDSFHYEIGKMCKEYNIDKVLACGKYANSYKNGYEKTEIVMDVVELSSKVLSYIKKGVVILIKASRAMQFEKIMEKIREITKC